MHQQKNQKPTSIPKYDPTQIKKADSHCSCGACYVPKAKMPDGVRCLKVYYKYVNGNQIPVILLQGEWIRKLGFEVEDHVIIHEKKGKLIIDLEKE
ncbi:SymE family type I addiction module toxin [Pedobacter mendelii]|uniref:Toxin SymE-like domain-containing protein n=1 Tax=Pedobacter mendelii TaxID=1908240 RepID=A0ABQ2BET8_9SPHI|nr:SymE family type I addiction module toxin [Pedobacter mendelii]GGI24386.1 hypothetical protein GCM10008119_12400 [Pedobacter mendelii]